MQENFNKILMYGASGHSKVVSSIFESMGFVIEGIFDDYSGEKDIIKLNSKYNIIKGYDKNYKPNIPLLISIGDNKVRALISKKIEHVYSKAIHTSSIIDNINCIGDGTAVFHHATIQRDVLIGRHCIVNTNASIDHDCTIQDFVHISPSATLCGNVSVGEGSHIGASATVIPNIKIGKWCIIGAGAIITKDIPDFSLVVGVPGKIIKILKYDEI